ncbi:hypothetical protein M885DRAFT_535443 [Pelagophyceae sp. CCMP2097]|nr:hypothetical protein M885DRAFT_535443 [Pelagophyceae sp. CCMP2097]
MAPCLLLALHSAWVLQQAARPAYSCGAKRPHRRSPPAALAPGTARAPSAAPRRRRCVALRAMEGGLEPAMLRSGLSAVEDRLDALISSSEPAANLELRLQDLELLSTAPGFWEDQRTAQATMAQITECASRLQRFKRWAELRTDAAEAVEA